MTIDPFLTWAETSKHDGTNGSHGGAEIHLRVKALGTLESGLNIVDSDDNEACFPNSLKRDETDKELLTC